MTCVVDSSYILRLVEPPDEPRGRRVRVLDPRLAARHEILVPELINYEVLNGVHRHQAGRLGTDLSERLQISADLLDGMEFVPPASGDRELIGRFVEQYGLSAYDAAFLALAKSHPDAYFVTLDGMLHEAARKELGERALDLDALEEHLAQ